MSYNEDAEFTAREIIDRVNRYGAGFYAQVEFLRDAFGISEALEEVYVSKFFGKKITRYGQFEPFTNQEQWQEIAIAHNLPTLTVTNPNEDTSGWVTAEMQTTADSPYDEAWRQFWEYDSQRTGITAYNRIVPFGFAGDYVFLMRGDRDHTIRPSEDFSDLRTWTLKAIVQATMDYERGCPDGKMGFLAQSFDLEYSDIREMWEQPITVCLRAFYVTEYGEVQPLNNWRYVSEVFDDDFVESYNYNDDYWTDASYGYCNLRVSQDDLENLRGSLNTAQARMIDCSEWGNGNGFVFVQIYRTTGERDY